MTLVLAWRDQRGAIHLASDSRMSFGPTTTEDFVPKILDLDVEAELVFTSPPTSYRTRLGVGVVGGYSLTQATWANVRFRLRALQVTPWGAPVDLASLVEQVRRTMKDVGSTIANVLTHLSNGALVVVGHCAKEDRARGFAVEARTWEDGRWDVRVREILANGPELECFGSGEKFVKPDHVAFFGNSPWLLLKYAIEARVDRAVGGSIQYGVVRAAGFDIGAVRDYRVDHAARTIQVGFASGGAFFDPALDFHLVRRGWATDPFITQIDALLADGYALTSG